MSLTVSATIIVYSLPHDNNRWRLKSLLVFQFSFTQQHC